MRSAAPSGVSTTRVGSMVAVTPSTFSSGSMAKNDGAHVEVALLDLEKSRRRLRRHAAARHDLRQLRRHCVAMSEPDWQRLLTAHAGYREVRCDVA